MKIEKMDTIIKLTIKNRITIILSCLFKKEFKMIFTNPNFIYHDSQNLKTTNGGENNG